jgi:hypothetical protein
VIGLEYATMERGARGAGVDGADRERKGGERVHEWGSFNTSPNAATAPWRSNPHAADRRPPLWRPAQG